MQAQRLSTPPPRPSPLPALVVDGEKSPLAAGDRDAESPAQTLWNAPSPTQTLGHSSPELPPLPALPTVGGLPRTPSTVVAKHPPEEAAYYTASWGSPYQRPPPDQNEKPSAQKDNSPYSGESVADDLEDPLGSPRFGLEHLIPPRLEDDEEPKFKFDLSHLLPARLRTPQPPSTPSRSAAAAWLNSLADKTPKPPSAPSKPGPLFFPREPTENWVKQYLTGQWQSEKSNWLSEGSTEDESEESLGETSQARTFQAKSQDKKRKSRKGHNLRKENLTLKQQDFWAHFGEKSKEQLTKMLASRFADPVPSPMQKEFLPESHPEPQSEPQLPGDVDPEARVPSPLPKDKPLPPPPSKNESVEQPTQLANGNLLAPPKVVDTAKAAISRNKKRVLWKGRNIVIQIPSDPLRGKEGGPPRPLSWNEVSERLKEFEQQGLNVVGFDTGFDEQGLPAQARPVFPDPEESRQEHAKKEFNVYIPDKRQWEDYVNFLTEQRLAALGVSLGMDDPITEMSRQGSAQYPGLAFSPPPQTSSAASTGIAGIAGPFSIPSGPSPGIPGHMSRASIASPISPFGNPRPTMHLHRASTITSSPNLIQQQPTPPGLPGWSPQPFVGQNGDIRGDSPALSSSRPELVNMLSPLSPFGGKPGQQYPFPQVNDDFTQMHQQQQALQQQLFQQQQQQLLNARPNSTLAGLPEEDGEEEHPGLRTPPRSNSGPNIVVPTPRGHRHNISENLEREIRDAEYHLEQAIDRQLDEDGEFGDGNRFAPLHGPLSNPIVANGHDNMWQNGHNGLNGFQQPQARAQSLSNSQHYGYHQHEVEDDQKTNISDVETNPSMEGQNDRDSGHQSYGSSQLNKVPTGPGHSSQGSKSSLGKFNVEAKEFKFNPGASFTPGNFSFGSNFQPQQPAEEQPKPPPSSSGKTVFHATAPSFAPSWKLNGLGVPPVPTAPMQIPQSSFNFSTQRPSFNPAAPSHEEVSTNQEQQSLEAPGKIFGNINLTDEDIVKPAKRSKAVPIIRPDLTQQGQPDEEEYFDETGHLRQAEWHQKRARRRSEEDNDVPKFATPAIVPSNAPPQPLGEATRAHNTHRIEHKRAVSPRPENKENQLPERSRQGTPAPQPMKVEPPKPIEMPPMPSDAETDKFGRRGHGSKSSLSGAARPFDYTPSAGLGVHVTKPSTDARVDSGHMPGQDMRQLSRSPANTYQPSEGGSFMTALETDKNAPYPEDDGPNYSFHQPTFDEIDDVMRTMAEGGSDCGIEKNHSPVWERTSPLRRPQAELRPTNLNDQYKRNAPSPDPHLLYASAPQTDAASLQDPFSDSRAGLAYESPVHNLNGPNNGRVSDWDDIVTSDEESKIKSRSKFFDNHVDALIDTVLQSRLGPLERNMHMIKDSITALAQIQQKRPGRGRRLSVSAEGESDADDEDDDLASNHRGRSPAKDRRMEKIRNIVVEALAAHQPHPSLAAGPVTSQGIDIAEFYQALADLKVSLARSAETSQQDDLRELMEEALARQSMALIQQKEAAARSEAQARITELERRLEEAEQRVDVTIQSRKIAESNENEAQRKLQLLEEELSLVRAQGLDDAARARALSEEGHDTRMKLNASESAQEELRRRLVTLETQNEALEATLSEYRLSGKKWHDDINRAKNDKDVLMKTINTLEARNQESLQVREQMRVKLEKLQNDMVVATTQVEEEKQSWQRREEEQLKRNEVLRARLEAEARTRERIEREMERLEMQEREMMRMKVILDQTQKANANMEDTINKQRAEVTDYKKRAEHFEREFHESKEVARAEIKRMRVLMETELDAANNQVNIVRAELESENNRLRAEIDNIKLDADTAKAKHELELESAADAKRDALQEAHDGRDRALREQQHRWEKTLDDERQRFSQALEDQKLRYETNFEDTKQRYDKTIEELHRQANRDVANAIDDRQRVETHLNDRLALSEEKIDYLRGRVRDLEENLEVARSAAHAAAVAAQSVKPPSPTESVQPSAQEKVSPQALRESIVVLQEQLQEREQRIEALEQQLAEFDHDAPAKLKERDTEIGWLRELLGVRVDDISELINALSQPAFDREAVRDTAIRIRTNLQMEQHEKERLIAGGSQGFPSITSISSFASPKAAQLAAAIGNWRKGNNGNTASKLSMSRSASNDPEQTPSKTNMAQGFLSGLMTPPTTAMRRSSSQQSHISIGSTIIPQSRGYLPTGLLSIPKQRAEPATPPLLRRAAYDQDPEDVDLDGGFRDLERDLRAAGFFNDDEPERDTVSLYEARTHKKNSDVNGHIRRASLTVDDEALKPFEPFGPILDD